MSAPARDRVLQALLSAVDEVNAMLPRGRRLARSPGATLVGDASPLDSLGLVNLIVAAEQKVEEEFGASLPLLDEAVAAPEGGALTVAGLADRLSRMLEDRAGE
jgi:hypothetical protein